MGKNKLKRFAEMKDFACVLEYPRERLVTEGFPFTGKWGSEFFKADRPITLELGCGKGEYTVGLARADAARSFIGVDVKGARIWRGAKTVEEEQIPNAAFLRAEIENIDKFFTPGEVDELWITFPDPQMQKTRKRLTSTRFLTLYSRFLKPGGVINLKTDSPFLYEYTRRLVEANGFEVLANTDDLYGSGRADASTAIKTFYESQWLSRGKTIKLISFRLPALPEEGYVEPKEDDIPKDDYRALCRPNPM
ncbi:MAG: tRNA (guanosine(46)-N7)-methyltransferase TrmB [Muribaculaceae bacterium]|nr:tRNA (guanosine(46)-N7)-methyltransferase TrmB [Bacteroides sp.]MDE7496367.1 tRNA (guanosine(46)-N7)-methyltransferase TrmB [Muribaculaceae bacterium]